MVFFSSFRTPYPEPNRDRPALALVEEARPPGRPAGRVDLAPRTNARATIIPPYAYYESSTHTLLD